MNKAHGWAPEPSGESPPNRRNLGLVGVVLLAACCGLGVEQAVVHVLMSPTEASASAAIAVVETEDDPRRVANALAVISGTRRDLAASIVAAAKRPGPAGADGRRFLVYAWFESVAALVEAGVMPASCLEEAAEDMAMMLEAIGEGK